MPDPGGVPGRLRCNGAGEIEVGTRRDSFGVWDTEVYPCPGCPDCEHRRRWTLAVADSAWTYAETVLTDEDLEAYQQGDGWEVVEVMPAFTDYELAEMRWFIEQWQLCHKRPAPSLTESQRGLLEKLGMLGGGAQ